VDWVKKIRFFVHPYSLPTIKNTLKKIRKNNNLSWFENGITRRVGKGVKMKFWVNMLQGKQQIILFYYKIETDGNV